MTEAYIVAAVRTAGGKRGGRLSGWHPVDLAGKIIDELLDRSGIDPALVDDVLMGCVSQVGEQSTNVARNAVLASKLPESVPGTSIDRQCGSSQQALHFAAQAVMAGTMDVVIAAGVESMSRVPMFTPSSLPQKNGLGYYMSPAIRKRYSTVPDFSQFIGAEMIAKKYKLSKDALDEYAFHSHRRAIDATKEGGVISAANASQICDGATGVLVVSEKGLKMLGVKPLARIHHMTVIGHDPVIMLEAPIPATLRALEKCGLKIDDIDVFEVNEAFASVPLAWLQVTGADPDRLNVNGGAIALGHPLGASGTKLMTTMINALRQRKKRYGLQTMCEGGGMANVTIIERL